jgi:hypothetical protein
VDTEKGDVQSDGIEQHDQVTEGAEPVEATVEAPKADEVKKFEELGKILSEREKAAADKARGDAERHFQSVSDKQVAAERRGRQEAERKAKQAEAHALAQKELFLAGLDPETRAVAEKNYNEKFQQHLTKLNQPTQEEVQEAYRFNQAVSDAKSVLAVLKSVFDISETDKRIDMTTPYTAYTTASALLKEKMNPPKVETKVETPKTEEKKKPPKVDEGGQKTSGKRTYTVAEIAEMSIADYAKNKDDINKARLEGRIK